MTDHLLPLPPPLQVHVRLTGPANRSLVFDRGFDRFERGGDTGCRFIKADPNAERPDGKTSFLQRFGSPGTFSVPDDYAPVTVRRRKALESAGARPVSRVSQTRLVIGLGLPHPTETALLLDRLTGCPYIPGSSIKGVLRRAAELLQRGDLEEDGSPPSRYSESEIARLFGPPADSELRAKGDLVFYDAFPDVWPALEVDGLTPHYQPYYGDAAEPPTLPPADWYDPNPVAFLTIAAGTAFTFWIGQRTPATDKTPLDRIETLLKAALAQLGIGGKTSTGYGIFGSDAPNPPRAVEPPEFEPLAEPPTPLGPNRALWEGADLFLKHMRPTVRGPGGQIAQGYRSSLPPAVFNQLQQGVILDADVVVEKRDRGAWSIVRIEALND